MRPDVAGVMATPTRTEHRLPGVAAPLALFAAGRGSPRPAVVLERGATPPAQAVRIAERLARSGYWVVLSDDPAGAAVAALRDGTLGTAPAAEVRVLPLDSVLAEAGEEGVPGWLMRRSPT